MYKILIYLLHFYSLHLNLIRDIFPNRIPNTVHQRVMRRAATGMSESATRRMATTGQTVPIPSRPGTAGTGHRTNRRAPTFRKYVKRREKSETTRRPGTSIQVSVLVKNLLERKLGILIRYASVLF